MGNRFDHPDQRIERTLSRSRSGLAIRRPVRAQNKMIDFNVKAGKNLGFPMSQSPPVHPGLPIRDQVTLKSLAQQLGVSAMTE